MHCQPLHTLRMHQVTLYYTQRKLKSYATLRFISETFIGVELYGEEEHNKCNGLLNLPQATDISGNTLLHTAESEIIGNM